MRFRFFNEFMSKAPDELQADCYLTNEKCWVELAVMLGILVRVNYCSMSSESFRKPEELVKRRAFSQPF